MDINTLIPLLDVEAAGLERTVRTHPALEPFYKRDFAGRDLAALRDGYLRFLKVTADYVRHSVPMLRAAGEAMSAGTEDDVEWSKLLFHYADDEIDPEGDYGHHHWAINDMRALGAPASLLEAPAHPIVDAYAHYLVKDARRHPYAILGTKAVLERLSLRICDDLVSGLVESGIPNAKDAASFLHHHGILDQEHVRDGDKNLEKVKGPERLRQVLEGAYFTGGCYRAFLQVCV